MQSSRLRILVEAAIMIALSAVLSMIKIWHLPYGGSVTLASMVPILLIGLRHGPGWGFLAGLATGLIQSLIDPYVVHPVQYVLDYPLAFAVLGLAGLARNKSTLAASVLGSLAIAARFVCHWLSGVVFFASDAPAGQSPWLYSAIYNGTYLLPELIISVVALYIILAALGRRMPGRSGTPDKHA